ncbi:MAG: hypothetical protein QW273_02340, partial [Candidatus Pacearchaeota archaeon]
GTMYIVRGIFIGLTPLGNPRPIPTGPPFHAFAKYEYGVYPSGHTTSSFFSFLFTKGVFKFFSFISFLGVIVFLIIARGHYSIDIFSAIFFSYAVYSFFSKNLESWYK